MLSAKDIADILGKAQILSATWMVQGGFVFESAGQTLSVNDTDGIKLRDLYGKAQLRLPLAGPPFLFGETSLALTPKATVHIGDGDIQGIVSPTLFNAHDVLSAYRIGTVQNAPSGVVGIILNQKYANASCLNPLEVAVFHNHPSGAGNASVGIHQVTRLCNAGTVDYAHGIMSRVMTSGATLANAYPMSSYVIADGGTVTNAFGMYIAQNVLNSGMIYSAYGIYMTFTNDASTLGTAYGLRIVYTGDIPTKWGIYIEDAAARNYIGGWLGIGESAPHLYEKFTIRQDDTDHSRSAMFIRRTGTGLLLGHESDEYHMSLGVNTVGAPFICLHGRHAPTTSAMLINDQSSNRGISMWYQADAGDFGRASITIQCNRSTAANAEFTNIYTYLRIGRALGLPCLNSSEMNALTTVPAGAMIYNTTRPGICFYTGAVWVLLGTAAYTDTHSDIPHTDSHGDAHTDTHGDAGHSDSHTDTPYSDVDHIDTHGDVTHVDTPYVDTHSDTHSDYDDNHHTDSYYDFHTDEHTNDHWDQHFDFHYDIAVPHWNSYMDDYADAHDDSYTDTIHTDTHYDHYDQVHADSHLDTHGDTPYSDTVHTDTHADVPHTDDVYVDSHTDSTHTDTHGDIAHEDWHVDHSDAL